MLSNFRSFLNFRSVFSKIKEEFLEKDSLLVSFSSFAQGGVGFVSTVVFSRWLSKQDLALYVYFFSIQGLFSICTLPGYELIIRKAATFGERGFLVFALRKTFFVSLVFGFLLSFILLILLLFGKKGFLWWKIDIGMVKIYFLTFLSLPLFSLEKMEQALIGLSEFKKLFYYRLIYCLGIIVGFIGVVCFSNSIAMVICMLLFSRALQAAYGLYSLKIELSFDKTILFGGGIYENSKEGNSYLNLKKQANGMFIYNIINCIVSNIQPAFLYHISSAHLANFYTGSKLPEKIKDYSKILLSTPVQKWIGRGEKYFIDKMAFYAIFYLFISFLITGILVMLSPWLVPFVFGGEYKDAVIVTQILAFIIPPKVAGSVIQQRELVWEDTVFYRRSGVIQAMFSLVIIYPLVSKYREIGLCYLSVLLSYITFGVSFIRYIYIRRVRKSFANLS